MSLDLVIRGGTVVTAADTSRCDVGIKDGTIVALGLDLAGEREIDATGRLVLPGGIDAHCHLDQAIGPGLHTADDFESGSRSAACGGTTTIVPFAAQDRGQRLRDVVEEYHGRAAGRSAIDYGFHTIVSDPSPDTIREDLPALAAEGCTSFKMYMTYDNLKLSDREIIECLVAAKAHGLQPMIHAENSDCIAWLTETLEAAGQVAPRFHAAARPPLVEREATHRAVSLAELVDVPVLIVHVSGEQAIEQIRWARSRGLRIHAETCPQYISLTAEDLDRDGFEGAKYVCSPPPRDADSHRAVWNGIQTGVLDVFSSDHAPFNFDDPAGKKIAGVNAPFREIPNGLPGLETRMTMLFSEGVAAGRIDLQTFVALTATNAARIYGLARKGTIAVGADADIGIWDPDTQWTITNADLHHAVDYTPYEGARVQGRCTTTVSRGSVVWEHDEFTGQPGHGRFVARQPRPRPPQPSPRQ